MPLGVSAAPLAALPDTVRVNVAGLRLVQGEFGSTGTLVVTDPDGKVLERGTADVAVRTRVYRLRDGPRLPDRGAPLADADARGDRLAALRDARIAEREAGAERVIELVPFEVAALTSRDPGQVLVRAARPVLLRFTAESGLLTFQGRAYRGSLELALDDENDLVVVNTVPTSAYLASVVGAEVPAGWHPEALAAQAVAVRTYLLTRLKGHRAYDVEGDVRDQAYGGVASEDPAAVRAVERTRGLVATYRGAAIEALYSANAGGVTEDSENVFANALPYLRSVPSPWDEEAARSSWAAASWSWTEELSARELAAMLARKGLDVGEPQRIELLQTSTSGRVLRARVVGSSATTEIRKDRTRYYFGLRSTLFTVERRLGERETVAADRAERVRELEEQGATRVRTGYSVTWDAAHEIATLAVSSYDYELPAAFVFTGRGFGHGVGMSQWGMQGMALAGRSYEEILEHYYTGIDLTRTAGP